MLDRHILRSGLLVALLAMASPAGAQTFTKITSGNPIATATVPATSQFTGCAWADYDGDGDQDFYIVQQGLYRNNGGGSFSLLAAIPADHANAIGCSWSDPDNDGDLDLFVAGGPPGGSVFYRNDGADAFTAITTGVMGDAVGNQGWACAWADYDLDGKTDLAVSAAFGFVGITTSNHMLHNLGALAFERVDTSAVSATTGPFTTPSWNDVDDDGDPDLFIASGPADGTTAPDFLYENRRVAPGETFFLRMTTGALATDAHDGQLYNWVDIDSDGDLDVFVTNYGGPASGLANDLYRNDGGSFTRLNAVAAGLIVSQANHSLASVWADFDNDGDLDCLVTNDGPEFSQFYTKNGAGLFTGVASTALRAAGPHYGAAAADYDGDGDVDVYMHGTTATRGLFRNNSNPASTNGWLDVRCVGTVSNRAALATRVWVHATIGGVPRQLVQQVSAQNSFAGHNALDLHFGLGNATVVDSVVVRFPSGIRQVLTAVAIRQSITVVEVVPTAVTVPHVSAEASLERVRVVWQLGEPESPFATVERRRAAGNWLVVGNVMLDRAGSVSFEDRDIIPGERYAYQLVVLESGVERRLGETWVSVPRDDGPTLEWLGGTPTRSRLRLAVTLPRGGDARMRMVDSGGRAVLRHDAVGLAPGRHVVDLGASAALPPGIYWMRMDHGAVARSARVVVLR